MSASLQNLYDLFFKKELVILSKPEPKSPPPTIQKPVPIITPMSKMILSGLSPESKEIMLKDLRADTFKIEAVERRNEELDPDYEEKMANGRLGFYMENVVSWYGVCPGCKQATLRKYFHSNVPVVDFVCINKDYHLQTQTCFLFQLKISLEDEYFSFRRQTITIGSRKYGEIPHTTKGTDLIYQKLVVPGYICLRLKPKGPFYQIDRDNSFVLVPNYHDNLNKSYYEYIPTQNRYGKDMISWNPSMFSTPSVEEILQITIVTSEYFEETPLKNPYN